MIGVRRRDDLTAFGFPDGFILDGRGDDYPTEWWVLDPAFSEVAHYWHDTSASRKDAPEWQRKAPWLFQFHGLGGGSSDTLRAPSPENVLKSIAIVLFDR